MEMLKFSTAVVDNLTVKSILTWKLKEKTTKTALKITLMWITNRIIKISGK